MARKVIDIIYNLVRKRLAVFNTKASGSGITRIPTDRQIKKAISMQFIFEKWSLLSTKGDQHGGN